MLAKAITYPAPQRGITLIEIAIGIAIVAIVMTFGMPTLIEWIQNAQIRTAAESIANGTRLARAEAVRRNANVEFTLLAPNTQGGTGWTTRVANTGSVIQSAPNAEGSRSAIVTPVPAGSTTITFNGYGRTPPNNLNVDGSPLMTSINVDIPASAFSSSDKRPMRITISTGGQVRLCDPLVSAPGDPRSCTPN